jgi:N-(2-amino-2-carboxyethyl)-L-glutamate synthase
VPRSVKGILATIGETPLVELESLYAGASFRAFAKLERVNPGGSIKDRPALAMLRQGLASGQIEPGRSVVVESSSGNLGIGLAQVCRYYGLRFICVVDRRTTEQNIAVLRAYGAVVEVVGRPGDGGHEYLSARLRRVRELLATTPHAVWPNQYANPMNPWAHQQTMREIDDALDGQADFVFCSTSTGGTLLGCAQYVRTHGRSTTIVAVDAEGSVLFGRPAGTRLIPGHGASVHPAVFDPSAADEVIHVSDLECVRACRQLVAREAILAGGSSGATAAALQRIAGLIPAGANCALIFADGGDRYLDTIFSDTWVREHFGDQAIVPDDDADLASVL